MHINAFFIKNFRAARHLEFATLKDINVIVGPNAVGKTTILEAIRLTKCVLSPRFFGESQQVLTSLGALSPHFAVLGSQGFDFSALANDPLKDIELKLVLSISDDEIATLQSHTEQIALSTLTSRLARPDAQQFELAQFLSTNEGVAQLDQARAETKKALDRYLHERKVTLHLTITAQSSNFQGSDLIAQTCVAVLERSLPTSKTKFSYFPADRAFPQGDIAMQFGSADAPAQVQSHMGAAASKYGRLKVSIAQGLLLGQTQAESLTREFQQIFDSLIPGKKFSGLVVNPIGAMKMMVQETATGKSFDIDNLSSGEKGIVTTFLLTSMSLTEGAILLLDEPELHLNPAVTKNILEYIRNHVVKKHKCQVFICTHSAEILSDAYESDDCNLFHLRSGSDLTPVYRQDEAEVVEVLERLGVTTADVLFSKGNIFVEGPHDEAILSEGFAGIVGGYKITGLGGREEVEKASRNEVETSIKDLEKSAGKLNKLKLFILDRDRKPVTFSNKGSVIVVQWQRYCLENYLLDDVPLFDVVAEYAIKKPESRGAFVQNLKADALRQVTRESVYRAYLQIDLQPAYFDGKEHRDKSISESADLIAKRLARIKDEALRFNESEWKASFVEEAERFCQKLQGEWETDWKSQADGKLLIHSLYERYNISLDKLSFKTRVVKAMKLQQTETWRVVAGILGDALKNA
jgi:predicted ATPase